MPLFTMDLGHDCGCNTCPHSQTRCRLCKWLQRRRCTATYSSVQQEGKMLRSICGMPGRVRVLQIQPGTVPDGPEVGISFVQFWVEAATVVQLELVIVDHLAYERCINKNDLATMAACEIRPSIGPDGQAWLARCTEAGFDEPKNCIYTVPLPGVGDAQELELDCCVPVNSSKLWKLRELKPVPNGKLRLAVKVVNPATRRLLAYLVGEPFHVLTGRSYNNPKTVIIPEGVDFVCANPVSVLCGVGVEGAKKLLRVPSYCAKFMEGRSDSVPEGLALPVAVKTVGEAQELLVLLETRWSSCPPQLKDELLPTRAVQQLKQRVLMEDTRLRRWQDPDSSWELLFKADQGVVTAGDLEVVLEHLFTVDGTRVNIMLNERLGNEAHDIVDGRCKLALERLKETNHPGWSVLEWEATSLRTFLHDQQPYMQGCWQMDKDACEQMLLSPARLPSLQSPQQSPLRSPAAPLSGSSTSPHFQNQPLTSACSDLDLQLEVAHSGQSWGAHTFHEEQNTGLPDLLPAVGASGGQKYRREGSQSAPHASDDLMQLSDVSGLLPGSSVAGGPHLSQAIMMSAQSCSQVPVLASPSVCGPPREQHPVAPIPSPVSPHSAGYMSVEAVSTDTADAFDDSTDASLTDFLQELKDLLDCQGTQGSFGRFPDFL